MTHHARNLKMEAACTSESSTTLSTSQSERWKNIFIYLFVGYLTRHPVARLYSVEIQLRHYPRMCLEGLRKPRETSVKIADIPVEIQAKNLPNKSQEPYRYASPLGCKSRIKSNSESS